MFLSEKTCSMMIDGSVLIEVNCNWIILDLNVSCYFQQASVPRWFFELSKNVVEDGTVSDCVRYYQQYTVMS